MSKKTTSKTTSKTTAKKNEITPTAWTRFLSSFIIGEIKRLGSEGYDREDDHWDWEEHEDVPGTYFVNYYAKSEEDAANFQKAVTAVVRRRGWQIDTDCFDWAEATRLGKETKGKHRGRALVYCYVAPAGTWNE